MSKTDQFWEGESKITRTCTSRHVNTDGNVTCTLIGLQNPASMHASIALELWVLKVGIISRFPLFYTSEGMKSLTNNKSPRVSTLVGELRN